MILMYCILDYIFMFAFQILTLTVRGNVGNLFARLNFAVGARHIVPMHTKKLHILLVGRLDNAHIFKKSREKAE